MELLAVLVQLVPGHVLAPVEKKDAEQAAMMFGNMAMLQMGIFVAMEPKLLASALPRVLGRVMEAAEE